MKLPYYPGLRNKLSGYGSEPSRAFFKELIRILKSGNAKNINDFLDRGAGESGVNVQVIPLGLLFAKLRQRGIEVDPATILDIQKIIATPELVPRNTGDLATILKPLICKNVAQLTRFDAGFKEFLAAIQPVRPTADNKRVTEILAAFDGDRALRKKITNAAVLSLALVAGAIGWGLWKVFEPPKPVVAIDIKLLSTQDSIDRKYYLAGDSIRLLSQITPADHILAVNEKITWVVNSDTIRAATVDAKLDTSQFDATLLLYKDDEIVSEESFGMKPACEALPSVEIVRETGNLLRQRITYRAHISNLSSDSSLYRYAWRVENKLVSRSATMDTILFQTTRLSIVLSVTYSEGVHCTADSLYTSLDDLIGEIPLTYSGTNDVRFNVIRKDKMIAMAFIGLFSISFGTYYLWTRYWRRRQTAKQTPGKDGEDHPYSLKFRKQGMTIQVDRNTATTVVNYNKRQTSEEVTPDIFKTIIRTVRAGGFPVIDYRAVLKKQEFIFLIDQSEITGHRQHLLDFLIEFLLRNQIELHCYRYYGNPEILSNWNNRSEVVSLGGLAKLSSQSILVVFTSIDCCFSYDEMKPQDWISDVRDEWQQKILISFRSNEDVALKTAILGSENFAVIPFRLHAITNALFGNENGAEWYNTRFKLSFADENITQLDAFLANYELQQWVYALAAYPKSDWEFTVAAGKSLERYFGKTLVTFENLEILSGLEWLNDGVISDEFRGQMLKRVDPKVHAVVLQTILTLLNQIKSEVSRSSVVWNELNVLETVNEFVLKGLLNDRRYVKDHLEKIEALRASGNLDAAIDVKIREGLPLHDKLAREAKWTAFPTGYVARGVVPFILATVLMLAAWVSPSINPWLKNDTSDTVRFALQGIPEGDSSFRNPSLSLRTYARTLSLSPDEKPTFSLTGLSRNEVLAGVKFRMLLISGDSLVYHIDTLKAMNTIRFDEEDRRQRVIVAFNNNDSIADVNRLMKALTDRNQFVPAGQPVFLPTITKTVIDAPDDIFKDLNVLVTRFSNATAPSQGHMDSARAGDVSIYLNYPKRPPDPQDRYLVEQSVLDEYEGARLKEISVKGKLNTTFVVAIIDPVRDSASIIGMKDKASRGIHPMRFVRDNPNVRVLFGSGFVETFNPLVPNGFLKIDNQVVNELKTQGYNGIAGASRNGNLELLPSRSRLDALTGGFQTGPFLVQNGQMVYNTSLSSANNRFNRAFIGVNRAGRIVAAITKKPVSLTELSNFLTSGQAGDLHCLTALNLSGGGSETLVFRTSKGDLVSEGGFVDYQSAMISFAKRVPVAADNVTSQIVQPNQNVAKEEYKMILQRNDYTGKGYQFWFTDDISVSVDDYKNKTTTATFRIGWNKKEGTAPFDLSIGETRTITVADKRYRITLKLIEFKNGGRNPFNREAYYNIKIEELVMKGNGKRP